LARLCGFLPLALRVAASFLAVRPSRKAADYLATLSDERARLEHLRDPNDPELDVPASIHLSYSTLEAADQKTLCQLSIWGLSSNGTESPVKRSRVTNCRR
jgi:hypothetical protein